MRIEQFSESNDSGGHTMTGVSVPSGGFAIDGTLGGAYGAGETTLFSPSKVSLWNALDQRKE